MRISEGFTVCTIVLIPGTMTLDNLSDSSLKCTWPALEDISVGYSDDRVQYRTVVTEQEAVSAWTRHWPTQFGKGTEQNKQTLSKKYNVLCLQLVWSSVSIYRHHYLQINAFMMLLGR
jgi:hypothetical protein